MVGWIPFSFGDYQLHRATVINGHDKPCSVIVKSNLLEPIEIESDDDFESSIWTGNGSISKPYVLANKTIEGDTCIWIERTSRYFRIENCTLTAEWYGIILNDISNAAIINNTIKTGLSSIIVGGGTNCTIANNSISRISSSISNSDAGIELIESGNSTIHDNVIKGGPIGIFIMSSSNCTLLRNSVTSNKQAISLQSSAYNNSIIENRFGSVTGEIAVDDGLNNSWDDGVFLGNAWINYDGAGEYLIPGSANSVDHFPTRFEPSFPMDFDGPTINVRIESATYDYYTQQPTSWTFEANVTDPSGVDTVLITINGISHVMSKSVDIHIYIYVHPYPLNMRYSFWANDTLGLSSDTEEGHILVGVYEPGTTPPGVYFVIAIVTGGALLVVTLALVAVKKNQSRNS